MRFAVLGPLLLIGDAGEEVPLTAARLRVLLAALALRANEPVSVDALADAVWDGVPPAGAAATLRSYVMRLRRSLGPAAGRIVTHDPGYLIRLDERESDVLMFEALCRATGSAIHAGSWGQASTNAAKALALWRAAPSAAGGWPGHANRLAATLLRYLETGGYHTETVAIHDHTRRAARALGDRAAEAEALHGLVVIDLRQGRYQQAADRLEQLLVVHGETGNRTGEADALGNLGIAGLLRGRYRHAISYLEQALAVYRETGDQAGAARQLSNLGLVEIRLGNYRQATQHLEQALILCRKTGNRSAEAYALSNLGVTSLRLGNHIQAGERLNQALTICRNSGNRDCEAYALGNLGLVSSLQGNHQQANELVERALTLCRETGDRSSEAETLNNLGEILRAAERFHDAQIQYAAALDLANHINDEYERARAHNGLAHSYHATGDLGQAFLHLRQALTSYTKLDTPEADQIRAQLARLAVPRVRHRDAMPPAQN